MNSYSSSSLLLFGVIVFVKSRFHIAIRYAVVP